MAVQRYRKSDGTWEVLQGGGGGGVTTYTLDLSMEDEENLILTESAKAHNAVLYNKIMEGELVSIFCAIGIGTYMSSISVADLGNSLMLVFIGDISNVNGVQASIFRLSLYPSGEIEFIAS